MLATHILAILLSTFLGTGQHISSGPTETIAIERSHHEYKLGNTTLNFIENTNQWDEEVAFGLKMGSVQMFLEESKIHFAMLHEDDVLHASDLWHSLDKHNLKDEDFMMRGHNFYMHFAGANEHPGIVGNNSKEGVYNYFRGSDPEKWGTGAKAHESVTYLDLYDGIDMMMYEYGNSVKYDFIVYASNDPKQIELEYEHVDDIYLKNGALFIKTSAGIVMENAPYAYQHINGQKIIVPCHFVLDEMTIRFAFPEGYDENVDLIIDPELIFSSYTGANDDNWGISATYDDEGNLYGGGIAFGSYPVTPGAFQVGFMGVRDMTISKFSPDGTNFLYSTYIGGNAEEYPQSMIVNSQSQLVIFGASSSFNYPTTAGAFDESTNGNFDIVVSILSEDGMNLIASTVVGSNGEDGINSAIVENYGDDFRGEVSLDDVDNVLIASCSGSANFPTTTGAFDESINGGQDGVLLQLLPDLSDLVYSTFLGGNGNDAAFALVVAPDNTVYVTGTTESANYPSTVGALDENLSGNRDGFVSRFSADGAMLLSSSFLGTNGFDLAFFVELDVDGDVYVLGQNLNADYPINGGAYISPNSTSFIQKMDADLTTSLFATVVGNGTDDKLVPSAFLVDNCKRIYVSGWGGGLAGFPSSTNNMPLSDDPIQDITDGQDYYLMVLSPNAAELEYATYFGSPSGTGEHVDGGTSRFDPNGVVYQAVCSCGGDFPTTPGVVSNTNNSFNCNLAVFKLDFELDSISIDADVMPNATGCAPLEVNFTNQSVASDSFIWIFGDGDMSNEAEPTHIYTEVGIFEVLVIALDKDNCLSPDTAFLTMNVLPEPITTYDTLDICQEGNITLESTHADFEDYEWQDGSMTPSIDIDAGGIYWVSALDSFGCYHIDSFMVEEIEFESSFISISPCESTDTLLNSEQNQVGTDYEWQDGSSGADYLANEDGLYWVRAETEEGCVRIDSFELNFVPSVFNVSSITICEGTDTLISSSNLSGQADYVWNTGADNSSLLVLNAGLYIVEASEDGCISVDSFFIDIIPLESSFQELSKCAGIDELLEASIQLPDLTYEWQDGSDGPSLLAEEGGLFWVRSINSGGCVNTDSFFVSEFRIIPVLEIVPPGCDTPAFGTILVDMMNEDLARPLSYSIDNRPAQSGSVFYDLESGPHTIYITDALGCSVERMTFIDDVIRVDIFLGDDTTIILGDEIEIFAGTNTELNDIDSIAWNFGDTTLCQTCFSQIVAPLQTTLYTIEAFSEAGCIDRSEMWVLVETPPVYVPNVFSPNGDNINDLFMIFSRDNTVSTVHTFRIYDRWGNMVFETRDFQPDDPVHGWNGLLKGELLNPAVFVWYADIEFIGGFRDIYKGNVTLLR